MLQDVRIADDLKSAAVLSGLVGVFGAMAVPFLLPSVFELVPPDKRSLPLPLPVFGGVLAILLFVVYGLFALAGLRFARASQREPAPFLTSIWTKQRREYFARSAGLAFATGIVCGLGLVAVIATIKAALPQTLPKVLHPSSLSGALFASGAASFGEEILCRLFLLSALLRTLPVSRKSTTLSVLISSLMFGACTRQLPSFFSVDSSTFHTSPGFGCFPSTRWLA